MVLFCQVVLCCSQQEFMVYDSFVMTIKLKEGREVVDDIILFVRSHPGRCRKDRQGEVMMQMKLCGTEIFVAVQHVRWSHAICDKALLVCIVFSASSTCATRLTLAYSLKNILLLENPQ